MSANIPLRKFFYWNLFFLAEHALLSRLTRTWISSNVDNITAHSRSTANDFSPGIKVFLNYFDKDIVLDKKARYDFMTLQMALLERYTLLNKISLDNFICDI